MAVGPPSLESWLHDAPGASLLEAETALLGEALDDVFGWELLQVGLWGPSRGLIHASRTRQQTLIAERVVEGVNLVARLPQLPIASGTVDAVLLPHTLEFLPDPKAMIRAIQEDACSVFNTGGNPGMSSFVANAYLAGAAGRPVWHGSGNDCGIVDASYLHSCAAAPNCTLPSDILSFLREDDLIVEPIPIKESYATVSDRPGLGVDLDKDAIRRYQVKS